MKKIILILCAIVLSSCGGGSSSGSSGGGDNTVYAEPTTLSVTNMDALLGKTNASNTNTILVKNNNSIPVKVVSYAVSGSSELGLISSVGSCSTIIPANSSCTIKVSTNISEQSLFASVVLSGSSSQLTIPFYTNVYPIKPLATTVADGVVLSYPLLVKANSSGIATFVVRAMVTAPSVSMSSFDIVDSAGVSVSPTVISGTTTGGSYSYGTLLEYSVSLASNDTNISLSFVGIRPSSSNLALRKSGKNVRYSAIDANDQIAFSITKISADAPLLSYPRSINSMDFATSGKQVISLYNYDTTAVSSINISNLLPSGTVIVDNACSSGVQPNSSCTITYKLAESIIYNGSLGYNFSYSDSSGAQVADVPLSFNYKVANAVAGISLVASDGSNNFVSDNNSTLVKRYTLTNNGTHPESSFDFSFSNSYFTMAESGSNPCTIVHTSNQYKVTNTLTTGQSCDLSVSFTSSVVESNQSATLSASYIYLNQDHVDSVATFVQPFTYTNKEATAVLEYSGVVTDPAIDLQVISKDGVTIESKSFFLVNNGSLAAKNISFAFTRTPESYYSFESSQCLSVLESHSSCLVIVSYGPVSNSFTIGGKGYGSDKATQDVTYQYTSKSTSANISSSFSQSYTMYVLPNGPLWKITSDGSGFKGGNGTDGNPFAISAGSSTTPVLQITITNASNATGTAESAWFDPSNLYASTDAKFVLSNGPSETTCPTSRNSAINMPPGSSCYFKFNIDPREVVDVSLNTQYIPASYYDEAGSQRKQLPNTSINISIYPGASVAINPVSSNSNSVIGSIAPNGAARLSFLLSGGFEESANAFSVAASSLSGGSMVTAAPTSCTVSSSSSSCYLALQANSAQGDVLFNYTPSLGNMEYNTSSKLTITSKTWQNYPELSNGVVTGATNVGDMSFTFFSDLTTPMIGFSPVFVAGQNIYSLKFKPYDNGWGNNYGTVSVYGNNYKIYTNNDVQYLFSLASTTPTSFNMMSRSNVYQNTTQIPFAALGGSITDYFVDKYSALFSGNKIYVLFRDYGKQFASSVKSYDLTNGGSWSYLGQSGFTGESIANHAFAVSGSNIYVAVQPDADGKLLSIYQGNTTTGNWQAITSPSSLGVAKYISMVAGDSNDIYLIYANSVTSLISSRITTTLKFYRYVNGSWISLSVPNIDSVASLNLFANNGVLYCSYTSNSNVSLAKYDTVNNVWQPVGNSAIYDGVASNAIVNFDVAGNPVVAYIVPNTYGNTVAMKVYK